MMALERFVEAAKGFSRNPLGIIVLFIVLVHGIAGLVLSSSADHLGVRDRSVLVWFLAIFPFAVLWMFYRLVSHHHEKLYSPSDFRSDDSFLGALTPERQKERLQAEIDETIVQETDRPVSAPLGAGDKGRRSALGEQIILAEELALRELEREYGVTINRQATLGRDFGFDGAFVLHGRGYGIEVKYLRMKPVISQFEIQFRTLANRVRSYGWKNFHILSVIVADDLSGIDVASLVDRLQTVSKDTGVSIEPKIYELKALRAKYGA